ncbi:hypothetical protein B0I37DRAFT_80078 [Chaetomium sp. MPI-CAGE-AT-0009]|nr:hypothetical protein B0I37DRAFT_80078 [Chaetomium sp. MPI-CAGE-AT-0009]
MARTSHDSFMTNHDLESAISEVPFFTPCVDDRFGLALHDLRPLRRHACDDLDSWIPTSHITIMNRTRLAGGSTISRQGRGTQEIERGEGMKRGRGWVADNGPLRKSGGSGLELWVGMAALWLPVLRFRLRGLFSSRIVSVLLFTGTHLLIQPPERGTSEPANHRRARHQSRGQGAENGEPGAGSNILGMEFGAFFSFVWRFGTNTLLLKVGL